MLFRLPSSRMNTAKVTVLGLSVCLYKYVPCFLRHRATRQQNNDRVPMGSSLHWLHFLKIIGIVSIYSIIFFWKRLFKCGGQVQWMDQYPQSEYYTIHRVSKISFWISWTSYIPVINPGQSQQRLATII